MYHVGDTISFESLMLPGFIGVDTSYLAVYLDKPMGDDITDAVITTNHADWYYAAASPEYMDKTYTMSAHNIKQYPRNTVIFKYGGWSNRSKITHPVVVHFKTGTITFN